MRETLAQFGARHSRGSARRWRGLAPKPRLSGLRTSQRRPAAAIRTGGAAAREAHLRSPLPVSLPHSYHDRSRSSLARLRKRPGLIPPRRWRRPRARP